MANGCRLSPISFHIKMMVTISRYQFYPPPKSSEYSDVMMSAMASQITSLIEPFIQAQIK